MTTIPTLVGNPLKEMTAKQLVGEEIYVLGCLNPREPIRDLYCINKENLFAGAFQDLDIDENVFNDPTFETSYQDILPNTFKGLPDLSRISITYNKPWLVEFRRNPIFNTEENGIQIVSTLTGIRLVRYGLNGVFTKWQLYGSDVIGAMQHLIVPGNAEGLNYKGWLPLIGSTYPKDYYPELYELLKDKVNKTDNIFTLPDAREHYLSANKDKAGQTAAWTLPDITDTVDFVKGMNKRESLIKPMVDVKKLFKVKGKDNSNTTMSYLEGSVIKTINTGAPVTGDGSGLTSELKLDLANKIGQEHVGNKSMPDTIFSSNLYIYAGYPQGY